MLLHYLVSRRLVPVFLLEIRDMVRNVEEAKALSLICRVQRRNKQVKKKRRDKKRSERVEGAIYELTAWAHGQVSLPHSGNCML
jgi:hypothetical protein